MLLRAILRSEALDGQSGEYLRIIEPPSQPGSKIGSSTHADSVTGLASRAPSLHNILSSLYLLFVLRQYIGIWPTLCLNAIDSGHAQASPPSAQVKAASAHVQRLKRHCPRKISCAYILSGKQTVMMKLENSQLLALSAYRIALYLNHLKNYANRRILISL
jgi:hypothetical protein